MANLLLILKLFHKNIKNTFIFFLVVTLTSACNHSNQSFYALASSVKWSRYHLSLENYHIPCAAWLECKNPLTPDDTNTISKKLRTLVNNKDLYQRGILQLATNSNPAWAAELFERSLATKTTANQWNDLAVAHLEAAANKENWDHLESAAHALHQALSLDAGHKAALWNLEALDRAIGAASHPPKKSIPDLAQWAQSQPSTDIVTSHSSLLREAIHGSSEILSAMAAAQNCQLHIWEPIAQKLQEGRQDKLFIDLLMECKNNNAEFQQLITAIQTYNANENTSAIQKLHIIKGKTPAIKALSRVILASSYYLSGESAKAKNILKQPVSTNYPTLAARRAHILGSLAIQASEYDLAIHFFESSAATATPVYQLNAMAYLAEAYARTGRLQDAWEVGSTALKAPVSENQWRRCGLMSFVSGEIGADYLQTRYARCYERLASEQTNAYFIIDSLLYLARLNLLNTAEHSHVISRIREKIYELPSADLQLLFRSYADLEEGKRLLFKSPNQAIKLLKNSAYYFSGAANWAEHTRALSHLVVAQRKSNDLQSANATLEQLQDNLLHAKTRSSNKNELTEHYRSVIDNSVELDADIGGDVTALETFIRLRTNRSVDWNQIRLLDKHTLVIIIARLSDRIIVWALNKDGLLNTLTTSISSENLNSIYRVARSHDRPVAGGRSRALRVVYDLIFDVSIIPSFKRIIIVPDREFYAIPFGELRSATGDLLIESHSLVVAPELEWKAKRERSIETISVIVPRHSQSSDLPFVSKEVVELANSWSGSSIIFDKAKPEDFETALINTDIVHFSGHGSVNAIRPGLSYLDFGVQRLSADDLVSGPRLNTRLVILAACDTAGYSPSLPSALALVRPLLDRGVSEVIGALRPVPDRVYAKLMLSYYKKLSNGLDAPDALRAAQLDLLHEDPTESWALVEVFSYLSKKSDSKHD